MLKVVSYISVDIYFDSSYPRIDLQMKIDSLGKGLKTTFIVGIRMHVHRCAMYINVKKTCISIQNHIFFQRYECLFISQCQLHIHM